MNKDWISIAKPKNLRDTLSIRGRDVEVFTSPHNVPEEVCGYSTPDSKMFTIEFRYLDEEPAATVTSDESTETRLGRFSKRIYQINIRLGRNHANQQEFAKEQALQAVTHLGEGESTKMSIKQNYQAVKEIIDQEQTALFSGLSA